MLSPSTGRTAGVEVRSLNEGGLVRSGESLSFVVHGDPGTTPELQLEIVLTDSHGNSVFRRTVSAPVMNEELKLLLPELEPGQYRVLFRTSGAGLTTDEQALTFFYTSGDYVVTGLSSYPPSTVPGAEITVQADLDYPEGEDPYVRWTQGATVLARGRVSDGLDRITWKAPQEQGVYPVTIELFPVPPPGNGDFPFSSARSMTARLYITSEPPQAAGVLGPDSSYYALFRFGVSLADRGLFEDRDPTDDRSRPAAEPFGGAAYSAGSPVSGYRIAPGAGIRYSRFILPLRSSAPSGPSEAAGTAPPSAGSVRTGSLAPCTITLLLVPEAQPEGGVLLTARSEDMALELFLAVDSEGRLTAALRTAQGGVVEFPSGIPALQAEVLQRVDLSLIPGEGTVTALWFLDGLQSAAVVRPVSLPEIVGPGLTVIGGEKGLKAVIVELGVYFRDEQGRPAVDPGIYRAEMRKRFGASLIMAEGFEGLHLPAGFLLTGGAAGSAAVTLAADPKTPGLLETPLFERALPATLIQLDSRTGFPPGSRIALQWEGETEGFAEIQVSRSGSAAVVDPRSPGQGAALEGLANRLVLRLSRDTLAGAPGGPESPGDDRSGAPELRDEPLQLPIRLPADRGGWLKVLVFGPTVPGSGPLELDRILIHRTTGP